MTVADLDIRRYRDGDRVAVWELHNLALHTVERGLQTIVPPVRFVLQDVAVTS